MNANIHRRGVLIIDGNDIDREILKAIASEEYRVFEAENENSGLAVLRDNMEDISLVLLDVQTPKDGGYDFLKVCRDDKLLSSLPVIIAADDCMRKNEESFLVSDVSDFITKPYNPFMILRRMENMIKLSESVSTIKAIEHDSITCLYTKTAFYLRAQHKIDYSDCIYDFLMISVEDFSRLNLRYGESSCEEFLLSMVELILDYEQDDLMGCRYSSDKLVFMRKHNVRIRHEIESERFVSKLRTVSPIPDFSVKFAIYDKVPRKVSIALLCDRLAITANSLSNQYNRSIAYYDANMIKKVERLKCMAECMESSLRDGQFKVYYQPKHSAVTGEMVGAEALVRWIHPEMGFMSPCEFIPLFEQNGFITDLDRYVFDTVCKDIREWKDNGLDPVPVSVNASRRDFVTIYSPQEVTDIIEKNGICREYLHLEITESYSIDDEDFLDMVRQIRNTGIMIELDDFGSGHSSLGSIRNIPMDVIKLDISFIRALEEQKEIVRMMISLAHALGLLTVAEGVETEEHISILRELGCDMFQGYYFSKPLSEADFREYLKRESVK